VPNPTTHFDVVIVGHGFAGLLTAALLSHLQIRVGVVDFDTPEPPCPLPVFGLHSATVVRQVLETCGLWLDVRARLAARPRAVGIALPDRRFRLEPALEARGRELGLAFADAREEMLALMERVAGYGGGLDALLASDLPLPPRGFAERRAVRRAVREVSASQLVDDPRRWSENRALRAFVGAALAVAGRDDDPDGPMTPGGARALWHLCHGVFGVRDQDSPHDPWAALEAAALIRCAAHGVVVEERRRATRAVVSNTGFEVRLDRGSVWRATAFVADLDDARLLALFDGNHDAVDAANGLALEVDAPRATRPRPFASPLGWVPGPGSRGHLVTDARRHGAPDALRVSAPASVVVQPSPVELLPSIREEHEVTVAASVPNGDRPPLGLFRGLPRRVPPQVRRVGFWTVPGLGLESLALSAHQAAQVCERQVRGGSLFDFLLPT
jgi:hypothetical protein